MNCDQFRHRLMIDPYSRDAGFLAHAAACSSCANAFEEAKRLEGRLRAALEAELAGADVMESRLASGVTVWLRPVHGLLVLPLLIAAVWFGLKGGGSVTDWEEVVLGHIQSEPAHLRAVGQVPWSRVNLLFRGLGVEADPDIEPAAYAGRCLIGPREGVHLVIRGERGPVTVLLMPGEPLSTERRFEGAGLEGVVLPADFGNLALMGAPGEPLETRARRLLHRVSRLPDGSGRSNGGARRRTPPVAAESGR